MSLDQRHFKNVRSMIAGRNLFEKEDDKLQVGVGYNFLTGIVQDVISNPYEFLNRNYGDTDFKLKDVLSGRIKEGEIAVSADAAGAIANQSSSNHQNVLDQSSPVQNSGNISFVNPQVIETMPMNSIFAYIIDDNQSKDDSKLTVCYPFFPPHLSLPLKSGEYVWIICENVKGVKYYYWMCRKVGSLQVEDINYTNMERIPAINDILEAQVTRGGNSEIDYTPAYALDEVEDLEQFDKPNKKTNMPISLSDILRTSFSYNTEFTGEPVPRLAKNCGDIVLQGSNNGGLHITTEKFDVDRVLETSSEFHIGNGTATTNTPPFRKPMAPAIDLFVGRKINALNQLKESASSSPSSELQVKVAANNCKNNFYNYVENDKMLDSKISDPTVYSSELFDNIPDATDVAARMYMSNKCSVDEIFGLNFDRLADDLKMGPSIISYAQHNRVAGNTDVRIASILGESFIEQNEIGNITLKAAKRSDPNKNDGKQLLKLTNGATGIARLQANKDGEIHLCARNTEHGDDGDTRPAEAYVRVSELENFITDLFGVLATMCAGIVAAGGSTIPTVGAVQSLITNLGIADSPATGDVKKIFDTYGPLGRKFRSTKIFGEAND